MPDGDAKSVATDHSLDDVRMEQRMGRLLQAGVLLAAAVVLAGGAIYLAGHAGARPDYRSFVPRPVSVRRPGGLVRALLSGDGSAIIQLGILLLVATPICRVVLAVVSFALERDRQYVTVGVVVLGVLLYGLLRVN